MERLKLTTCIMLILLSSSGRGQNAEIIKYNNEITVDLGVGLWGIPIPVDYDKDGLKDLLVSCPDKPYKGLYYFKNIGSKEKPFFEKAEKLSDVGLNNIKYSEFSSEIHILSKGKEWLDFLSDPYGRYKEITYEGARLEDENKRSRSNMWVYCDWDNDKDKDIIVGIDTWADYGWDNAFDKHGQWTRGPLHGYVYLLENVEGKYVNKGKIKAGDNNIDVYGAPNPCVDDFDGDGDLDIICGEFLDGLTWFENIGNRSEPKLAEGRRLQNRNGEIRFHLEMIVPVTCDFDDDGHTDLIVGDEDGRIAWLRHTGKVRNNMPVFNDPYYFKQKADNVKFGALSTPYCFDWDNDGDEDIITGNSAGEIALIRNISGGESPVWGKPELFHCGGKPIRIQAGYNGSIQGPAEKKWGYTVLSVADWDNDGKADIIINSILGKIEWFRNPGKRDCLMLDEAQPVIVNWDKEIPYPSWNWWKPENGHLVSQWRTTPVATDYNKDGLTDLIMLDHEGYLAYYERFALSDGTLLLKPGVRIFYDNNTSEFLRLNDKSAGKSGRRKICFTDWDGDGRTDLIANSTNACLYKNVKEDNGRVWYEYVGNLADTILAGHTTAPAVSDWNCDGIPDLILGAEDGHFYLIKNNR